MTLLELFNQTWDADIRRALAGDNMGWLISLKDSFDTRKIGGCSPAKKTHTENQPSIENGGRPA